MNETVRRVAQTIAGSAALVTVAGAGYCAHEKLITPDFARKARVEAELQCRSDYIEPLTADLEECRQTVTQIRSGAEIEDIDFVQACQGRGLACGEPYRLKFAEPSLVRLEYGVGRINCAPITLRVRIDDAQPFPVGPFSWAGSDDDRPVLQTVIDQTRSYVERVEIDAVAQADGCATGGVLERWGGRFRVVVRPDSG